MSFRVWGLGFGLWAERDTHRDGALTGRRGRLHHEGRVQVSVRRTVQRTLSCLGEKGQRKAIQSWPRPANKGEWWILPRTSMGQDRVCLAVTMVSEFNAKAVLPGRGKARRRGVNFPN